MRYRILSKVRLAESSALSLLAQPVGERGEGRGADLFIVPPGLLCASLGAAMEEGEVWGLDLADDGQTVIGASFSGEEQTA